MWFGVEGAWISKVQIFSHCPVALNCNLSFNFPLCIKHVCASSGQMYSIWEDDPDSYKLEFVYRDARNVATCRVSRGPVTSSTVCSVAASLGLTPLSTDFTLHLETVFPSSCHRDGRAGAPLRLCWAHPPQAGSHTPRMVLSQGHHCLSCT